MKRKRRGRPPKTVEEPPTAAFTFEMALSHSLLLQCSALEVEQSLETQVSAFSGSPVTLAVKRDGEDRVSFIFSDSSKEDLFNLAEDRWSCSINDIVYEDPSKSSDDFVPDLEEFEVHVLQEDLDILVENEEEEKIVVEEEETEEEHLQSAFAGRYHTSREVKEILERMAMACKMCQRTFHSLRSLHRHVAIKHKMSSKVYENMEETNVVVKPERQVRRAKRKVAKVDELDGDTVKMEAKERFTCGLCSQQLSSLSTCRSHVLLKHKGDKRMNAFLKELEANKLKACKKVSSISINCIICDEECPGMRILRHLKTWHADLENLDEVLKDAKQQYYRQKNGALRSKNDTLVKCPHCMKELKAASIHCHVKFRCKHNSERRKLYECSLCGFGTVFEDAYLEHKQSHAPGQKDYTCADCGKSFRAKAGLQMHQRKQHGLVMKVPLTRYNCEPCQRTYTEKSRYEKHIQSKHSGLVVCSSCGKIKSEGHTCQDPSWIQERVVTGGRSDAAVVKDEQQQQEEVVFLIDSQLMRNEGLQLPEEFVQGIEMSSEPGVLMPQENQEVDGLYGQNFAVDEATLSSFMDDKTKWAVLETVVLGNDKTVVSQSIAQ